MNAGLPHPRRFFFALAALFALLFLTGYGGSNLIAAYIPWHISPALPFESAIPFLPAWSAVYLTVPLLLAASVRWADWRETWALFAVLTAELAAACPFFILLPVQTAYPPRLAEGFWQPWFALADHLSMAHNHLPSLHAAFACTATLAAWRHSAARFALIAPWAAAVVASTLLIHEHHLSDLVCGALLAAAVWHTVGPWARRPDILRRVSVEWQMLLEQAAFARRHRRYALISLILAAYRLRHPARGGLLVSGYCFLQAFDDLMDGDRQTARTADEEARRLIREWRHGRFDENDPYSWLATDFRGRLKTSEASFCEAKTKAVSSCEAKTDIEGLGEAKANAKYSGKTETLCPHPWRLLGKANAKYSGKTETVLPAAAARFALTRTLGLLHTMHLDRLRAERAQLWTEAEIAAQHRRTFTRSLDLLLAALGSSVRGRDLPELVDALGWCSTMRDLPEDLRAGIVNIPSELWRQAGWPSEKRHDPAALSADAAFRDWMRQERNRALQLLDQADLRTAALNDETARRISNLFARSVRRFAEQRLPARYPWLNGPTEQAV